MATSGGKLLRKDRRVQRDSCKIRQSRLQLRGVLEPRSNFFILKMTVHKLKLRFFSQVEIRTPLAKNIVGNLLKICETRATFRPTYSF